MKEFLMSAAYNCPVSIISETREKHPTLWVWMANIYEERKKTHTHPGYHHHIGISCHDRNEITHSRRVIEESYA